MTEQETDPAVVNYGGAIKDAAGRPALETVPGAAGERDGVVDEQLSRILPKEG